MLRKDLGFKVQAYDKNLAVNASADQPVHYVTFDLQKTMPLPKLSTSIASYLRQVLLYNLGVHVSSSTANGAFFQLWTEDEAGYEAVMKCAVHC